MKANFTETETNSLVKNKEQIKKSKNIILYNDDVNSFEFVIETLVEICKHAPQQAEQCAYLVHYVGKCSVKTDEFEKLKPLCTELLNRGLTAEIE